MNHRNGTKFELRKYQETIGNMARKENLIACLPTGSGKTLISVYLMVTEEIKRKVESGKKIVFVVNTVSLANQQAAYIKQNSGYAVICCTGQSSKSNNVDWYWQQNMNSYSVIVMTSQYCFDKLAHGFLSFQQLALLVLDECHHVGKNHPMKKIMELYEDYHVNNPPSLPRIFGMTASIVKTSRKNDVNSERIARDIAVIEKQMMAKAVTYADFDELLKYSTKPTIITVVYPDQSGPLWADGKLITGIKEVSQLVNQRCSISVDLMRIMEEARAANLPNFSLAKLFKSNSKHNFYVDLVNTLDDFMEIYNELGPLGAQILADIRLKWMKNQAHKATSSKERVIFAAVQTQFRLFIAKVIELSVDKRQRPRSLDDLVSYKANLLMQNLSKFKDNEGTAQALVGLIFVKRRSCAVSLKMMIEEFIQADPIKYGFIKPGLVTGTNNIKKESLETRISPAQQKECLKQFREQNLNLIICTTVLEEGIDVPEVNLVVRFNELQAYTSWIQSMGRARKDGGQYHIFTSTTEFEKNQSLITKFMQQNDSIKEALLDELSSEVILFEDEMESIDDADVENFAPFGPDGAKITASAAIQLVNRFCQRSTTPLKVFSWWTSVSPDPHNPKATYQGYVWIQENPYIHDYIQGPKCVSLSGAKKSAYLKVCEDLYNKGALDSHLFPK